MKNNKEVVQIEKELQLRLAISADDIACFCERWHVTEMSIFGSALRSDFGPDSDIDVLIEFKNGKVPGLAFVDMAEEMEQMFGRPVDLVTRFAIERSKNPLRRKEILGSAKVIHAR